MTTPQNDVAALLALLADRGILNRVTKIRVGDVALEMAATPMPLTELEQAKSDANRAREQAAWEHRIGRGHVGGFVEKDLIGPDIAPRGGRRA